MDMNIFNNGTQQYLENKQGHMNVSGNHNIIHIRNSTLTLSVNGNHNTFHLQYCNLNVQVNGNANRFRNSHNNLRFGFNGNNNQVQFDHHSNYQCQYCNGGNNRFPRQPQRQPENYQQARERNRNNEPQFRQRNNRNRNQLQNNQPRREEREQRDQRFPREQPEYREQRQPRQPRQQQMYIPQFHPINEMQYGFMNSHPFGFFDHIQNSLNAMFQGQRGIRPNRNVFVFHEEQEQQQERGLSKELYDLLPRSEHKGRAVNCTICLDDICQGNEETFLICFHAFHTSCIKDWLFKSAKCPVCQYDLKEYFNK